MGNKSAVDAMVHDGLWDPYNDQHMGHCGEVCAEHYGFTRQVSGIFTRGEGGPYTFSVWWTSLVDRL